MATLWEGAAHSVNRIFSLLCLNVAVNVSHFGFEGRYFGSDFICRNMNIIYATAYKQMKKTCPHV